MMRASALNRLRRRVCALWCAVGLLLPTARVNGDGGTVRLKQTSGNFVITVFTAPEPLRVGLIDVSVLVQDSEHGEPILDADVSIDLTLPAGSNVGAPISVAATHAQATNKLLYAAQIDLPAARTGRLRVDVRRGSQVVVVSTDLPVAIPAAALGDVWIYLLLPLVVILLFTLHQWRSRRATM